MNKFIALIAFLFFFSYFIVNAHPGNTDTAGCHTCKTNCPNWGLSYGEYHCHNNKGVAQPSHPVRSTYGASGTGYTSPAPYYAAPTTYNCPSMSSYDFLSGSCKCNSGYIVSEDYLGNESCVNANSYCMTKVDLMSEYNSFSNQCECRSGYEFDGFSCKYKKSAFSSQSYSTGNNIVFTKNLDTVQIKKLEKKYNTECNKNLSSEKCRDALSAYTDALVNAPSIQKYVKKNGKILTCKSGTNVDRIKEKCVKQEQ
ncbi:MAG TPA: YHYH domain-containing protein [Candidatus Paceibacterota bacterium]|nr:YHYH domain-containing protein [Candidatus Paceibacterota bacterium]